MTLQEWMILNDVKDAALAAQVRVLSRSQISRIRRGKSRPTPDAARQLEAVTQIPAATFVMGEAA